MFCNTYLRPISKQKLDTIATIQTGLITALCATLDVGFFLADVRFVILHVHLIITSPSRPQECEYNTTSEREMPNNWYRHS